MFEASFLFELNDQLTLVLWRFGLDHVVIVAPKEFDRMSGMCLTGAVFVALVELVLGVLAEHLLALLHARIISSLLNSSWSSLSMWHSGQSNHFLQH